MGHCSRDPGTERRRFFGLKRYVRADHALSRVGRIERAARWEKLSTRCVASWGELGVELSILDGELSHDCYPD
jgi:hypothetical protein